MVLTIQCGFNAIDETINFGNRGLADNASFESATLATLKSQATFKDAPFINTKVVDGQLFYGIDNFFGVFSDRECSASEFTHNFEVVIDNICVSPNKFLVLIFLRNGSVAILRRHPKGYIIEETMFISEQHPSDEIRFIECYSEYFKYNENLSQMSVIAVVKNGQIYRFIVDEEDSRISTSIDEIYNFESEINISAYCRKNLFIEGKSMSILDVTTNKIVTDQAVGIIHCQFANLNILALLKSGKLLYICPFTLCCFPINIDTNIRNISVLVDDKSRLKCITAQSQKDELGESYLHYLNPDFSIKYSLKMSTDIHLISPEFEMDDIQYISLVRSGNVLEFRFKYIYETDPQERLRKLIRKNMIAEAEKFATTHNIDLKVLNREKALLYFKKLKCTKQEIDDLINIFRSLDDQKFILVCCNTVQSLCDNPDDVLRVLKYGCDLNVDKKNTETKKERLLCIELYQRFNIFVSIGYNFSYWPDFSISDVGDELKDLLRKHEVAKAVLLYNYINTQNLPNLDQKFIEDIINILNNSQIDIFIPFLPTFFQVTLKRSTKVSPMIAKWIETKIFEMESQNIEDFPQKAIDFLQNSMEFLKINSKHDEYESNIDNLVKLREYLDNLNELKINYGVSIALKELKQEPKAVVRSLLNLKLPLHSYNKMLQEFAYKFMLKNELDPDEILCQEISDLLNYEESYWTDIVSSILHCIGSIEQKTKAVEEILLTANKPWNTTIRQIALQTLDYTHPNMGRIRQIMKDEPWLVVTCRKEYGIKSYTSNIGCLRLFAKRIMYCNLPTMEDDLFILCQKNKDMKVEVFRLLFHHYFEARDFEKAFRLFEDPQLEVEKCSELILQDILNLCEYMEVSELLHYSSALNILIERNCTLTEIRKPSWMKNVNLLKNIFDFNIHFGLIITPDKLRRDEEKRNIINDLIIKMLSDYEDGITIISDVVDSCYKLSLCTGEFNEKYLLQCCTTVYSNKNEILNRVVEELLNNSNNAEYLTILTVYLLQNLNDTVVNQTIENSFIDYNSGTDQFLCQSLKSAHDLVTKAVLVSNQQELIKCLKIVPWVDSIYFIKRQTNGTDNVDDFEDGLELSKINPSAASITAIQRIFNMFTSFIAEFRNEEHEFLTYFNRNQENVSEEEFLGELHEFQRVVLALNQDGDSLLSYRLLTTLQNQLMAQQNLNERILKNINEMIKTQCIPNVVHTSLLMGCVNENLLQASLAWCDSKETKKYIEYSLKFHRKIPSKVAEIAKVGVILFDHHKCLAEKNYCQEVLISVGWWEKVKHLGIEYNKFFQSNSKNRLEMLISTENFELEWMEKYCSEYKLENSDYFHLLYLKNFLLNWTPKYRIITSNIGKRELVMEENQDKYLHSKCIKVIKSIKATKIDQFLKDLWEQINFYHYEVFECILNILDDNYSFIPIRNMLEFLKEYNRINEPGDTEREKWTSSFPNSQTIDPLSEFRLLFNSTIMNSKDIWNIIRREISLGNYKTWFRAVQVFNRLTKDNICSFLVKEIIAQDILRTIRPGEWLYPEHTDFFMNINDCLQHMENIEMKISAANCLLSNTPDGADQVTIAKIAYQYALEYKNQETSSTAAISFTKIEKKYQKCSCLQILHINNLAEPIYTNLILDSDQLLTALYHDERIFQQKGNCPDINKAADQLAETLGSDITEFRKHLIKIWLVDSENSFDKNMSLGFSDDTSVLQKNTPKEANNLKRAAYVCSSDLSFWTEYLLNEGCLGDISQDSNSYYRSRCLKCLVTVADVATIERLTLMDFASFMSLVDRQTLFSILYKFNILDFDETKSWKILTKKLARIGNPDSVKALAQACMILKYTKANYWEYIIKSANIFGMFSELAEYLDYTKMADYKFDKFYVEAWQKLIDHTINVTLGLSREEMGKKLLKDLFMIQQCPVAFLLDLENIYQKCFNAKKIGAALFITQYISKEISVKALENLKNNFSLQYLFKELEILESHGLAVTIKDLIDC